MVRSAKVMNTEESERKCPLIQSAKSVAARVSAMGLHPQTSRALLCSVTNISIAVGDVAHIVAAADADLVPWMVSMLRFFGRRQ